MVSGAASQCAETTRIAVGVGSSAAHAASCDTHSSSSTSGGAPWDRYRVGTAHRAARARSSVPETTSCPSRFDHAGLGCTHESDSARCDFPEEGRTSRGGGCRHPRPGPGEVVVDIIACGVCHTDLTYREGGINDEYPFLLGHEAAGTVESIGAGRHERGARRLRDPELARGVRAVPRLQARPPAVLLRHVQRRPEDDADRRHRADPGAGHRRVRRQDAGPRRPVHQGRSGRRPRGRRAARLRRDGRHRVRRSTPARSAATTPSR